MKSSVIYYYVADKKESLPVSAVAKLHISASIHTPYPTGYIILNDEEGKMLEGLALHPGNMINISLRDTSEDTETQKGQSYAFTPFLVVGLENMDYVSKPRALKDLDPQNGRLGTLGGQIKVHLAHPWAVYSDWTNRAYLGSEGLSKIVNHIIDSGVTGRGFSFAGKKVDQTDDGSKGPNRYKLQESEAAFIEGKILPYATSEDQPMYFFVDETNVVHFETFSSMYKTAPRVTITAPFTELGAGGDAMAKALKKTTKHQELTRGFWHIGRNFKEQVRAIKRQLFVEDSDSNLTFKATMMYESAIPGHTLVNSGLVNATDAMKVECVPHRSFGDAVRLTKNQAAPMNEFFEIGVTTQCTLDVATIGTTVNLALLGTEEGRTHWANGTWVVTAIEYYTLKGELYSKLLLARPTIDRMPSNLEPEKYYKL